MTVSLTGKENVRRKALHVSSALSNGISNNRLLGDTVSLTRLSPGMTVVVVLHNTSTGRDSRTHGATTIVALVRGHLTER